VYVVGTSGISRELSHLGIRNFGVGVSKQDTLEGIHWISAMIFSIGISYIILLE
jgi:hypothetical protein